MDGVDEPRLNSELTDEEIESSIKNKFKKLEKNKKRIVDINRRAYPLIKS